MYFFLGRNGQLMLRAIFDVCGCDTFPNSNFVVWVLITFEIIYPRFERRFIYIHKRLMQSTDSFKLLISQLCMLNQAWLERGSRNSY